MYLSSACLKLGHSSRAIKYVFKFSSFKIWAFELSSLIMTFEPSGAEPDYSTSSAQPKLEVGY
jgi:hypothetical protein